MRSQITDKEKEGLFAALPFGEEIDRAGGDPPVVLHRAAVVAGMKLIEAWRKPGLCQYG